MKKVKLTGIFLVRLALVIIFVLLQIVLIPIKLLSGFASKILAFFAFIYTLMVIFYFFRQEWATLWNSFLWMIGLYASTFITQKLYEDEDLGRFLADKIFDKLDAIQAKIMTE